LQLTLNMKKALNIIRRFKSIHNTPRPKLTLIINPTHPHPQKEKFKLFQKLLILTFLLFGLLFCSSLYSSGPDVLTAQPKAHKFSQIWDYSKAAQLKTLAMLIEMYPEHELYFLDRDARFLGQTGLLIGEIENEPKLKARIHFLNVSRKNVTDPLLRDYLQQEGISEEHLKQGKKILFVDTGFIGSLPRHMIKLFPSHKEQFDVHMIVAAADDREHRNPFPSTRVFGTEFSKVYPEQDIFDSQIDVVHSYATLPKSDMRSDFYVKDPNGKIIPESSLGSRDPNDGEINPIKARQHEEDLQHFMRESNHRLLLDKLRRDWRTAHRLWSDGKKAELIDELKRWVNIKGPQGLAMAMDFIELNHTNLIGKFTITPDDIGIKRQEFNYNLERLKHHNLPLWSFRSCRRLVGGLAN